MKITDFLAVMLLYAVAVVCCTWAIAVLLQPNIVYQYQSYFRGGWLGTSTIRHEIAAIGFGGIALVLALRKSKTP